VLNPKWILTDHHLRHLFNRIFGASLANAGDAAVCLDLDNTPSLIE
jgi:hypothetical protein